MNWKALLFFIPLGVAGCYREHPMVSTIEPHPTGPALPAPASSIEQLGEQFFDADKRHDLETIKQLICWDGVDAATRASVEKSIATDMEMKIKGFSKKKLAANDMLEYKRDGKTYRPNLKPIVHLEFQFAGGSVVTTTSYLVGLKDGIYKIATAAPVS